MSSDQTEIRKILLENNYIPLPVKSKRPYGKGWTDWDVDPAMIETWDERHLGPDCTGLSLDSTGVRCDNIAAIDMDINDEALLVGVDALVVDVLGDTPCYRFSRPGRGMMFYRCDDGQHRSRTGRYGEKASQVEVYTGRGCQVACFGRHSDGLSYAFEEQSLLDVPRESLPLVTQAQLVALLAQVQEWFTEHGLEKHAADEGAGGGYASRYELTPDMVFTVDGVEWTVAEMMTSGRELRCRMDGVRPDADDDSAGVAKTLEDGTFVIFDHTHDWTWRLPPPDLGLRAREQLAAAVAEVHSGHEWEQYRDYVAGLEDDVERDAARYGFVASENWYRRMDVDADLKLVKGAMVSRYPQQIPVGEKGKTLTKSTLIMRSVAQFETEVFAPDQGLVYSDAGVDILNTYRPPARRGPARGDLGLFDELIERNGFDAFAYDWLAYKLQHPGTRGPVLLSISDKDEQGTGRGTLQRLIKRLWGRRYVKDVPWSVVSGKSHQGQYQDWLDQALWLCIPEVMTHLPGNSTRQDRLATYEVLKDLAEPGETERQVTRKGRSNLFIKVHSTLFLSSNHHLPLMIPETDRRIHVVQSEMRDDSSSFWEKVHAAIEDDAWVNAVALKLEANRSAYRPTHAPPFTDRKLRLIEAGVSDVDQNAEDCIEWMPSIVSGTRIESWVERFLKLVVHKGSSGSLELSKVRLIASIVRQSMRPIPAMASPDNLIRVGDERLRVHMIRDYSKWERLSQRLSHSELITAVKQEAMKVGGADVVPFDPDDDW